MEKRRLSIVFLYGTLIASCILCSQSLYAGHTSGTSGVKIYRSGPSQEEINRNFEYEREKEENAWDMLKNSFFDIHVDNPFYDNSPKSYPSIKPSAPSQTR